MLEREDLHLLCDSMPCLDWVLDLSCSTNDQFVRFYFVISSKALELC
jgi:hypothetical protein